MADEQKHILAPKNPPQNPVKVDLTAKEVEEARLLRELEEQEQIAAHPYVKQLVAAAEARGEAKAKAALVSESHSINVTGKKVSGDDIVVRALKDLPNILRGAIGSRSARYYNAKVGENIYMHPSHAAELANPLGKKNPGGEAWVVIISK